MLPTAHPEILANDWLPPIALGRQREVHEVLRRLDVPTPAADPPWIVGVGGPSGSGTSTVARRAARDAADRLRAHDSTHFPRLIAVRVANLRGTHGVAAALLQRFDEGFDGRGFPTPEIIAGFLRRIRREGRPCILVLDDLGPAGPEIAPIVNAVGEPDRFLPEGQTGLPPVWTVLGGTVEALHRLAVSLPERIPITPFVCLSPYGESELGAIVKDRAERALGRQLQEGTLRSLLDRTLEEGGGARRAIDLLRRVLLGWPPVSSLGPPRVRPELGVPVEPRVVRAIGVASRGVLAPVGDVRRLEAELARSQGARPLPTTTLWRRIVRLEQAGYVRREIRPGGNGGTRSLLRVLTPIDEWVTLARPTDTPREFAAWNDGDDWSAVDPAGRIPPRGPPDAALLPSDDGPDS
jgi:hypothetical protein